MAISAAVAAVSAQDAASAAAGRVLFAQQCASCHSLAHEGFGPPLGGITSLLEPHEIVRWIRDPAAVLAAGDARANALLRRYRVPMPPFAHLSDGEIESLIAYLEQESAERQLQPLVVDPEASAALAPRLAPPVQPSGLVIELEDRVQIPRLPGRTPYKGITLLRPDPREAGALFVDELMGLLYRVAAGEVHVFLDLRGQFPEFLCDPGVASGLGSFALHPEFVRNGVFYTMHSERFRGSPAINSTDIPPDVPAWETPPLEWVLSEWQLDDLAAAAFTGTHREVLRFVTPTTGHAAQEIAFAPVTPDDPDFGLLYVGIGDGGSGNLGRPDLAGHPRTLLGSILRIDPAGSDGANGRYGIPPDNPFATAVDPAIRREIWAYGFRNPHRFSWDLAHGKRLIAVDIGEANVEEINLIERGGAYGWGAAGLEGRMRIDARRDLKVVTVATERELAGVRLPLAAYDHSEGSAVTGGYVYRGPLEVLRGRYVFGDIVNGRLFYLEMGRDLTDRTIYELHVMREGAAATVRELAGAERAHLRIGYDDRTGDLFVLTKDDGMVRRVVSARKR